MTDSPSSSAPKDPRIGEIINDKYRIDRKLGEGGMGAVYQGEHTLIGRQVAIKLLRPEIAQEEQLLTRFQREARAATSIGHDHIVDVTDMGKLDDGSAYMVLEYLDGRELGDDMAQERLPIERLVHIVVQVCDALAAAHDLGIIHRDLKPANIFLINKAGDPDFVKVLDFGVAKARGEEGQNETLTQTGIALGTPAYMAPEQAQNVKAIDHRADIYSLGVIMYEALSGCRPFSGESFVQLMVSVVCDEPPSLKTMRPDLPDELTSLIDRLLSKNPDDRVADCRELAALLAPFAGLEPASVRAALTPTPKAAEGQPSSKSEASDPPKSTEAAPASRDDESPTVGARPQKPRSDPRLEATVPAQQGAPLPATVSGAPPPTLLESGATTTASPEARGSKGRGLLITAAIVVVALALVGGAAALGFFEGEEVAAADEETQERPAPTPADSNTKVELVRVQIATSPAGAKLFLDGEPIANPFDAELPQQAEPRRVEARLDGHTTVAESITLRYPQKVHLELPPAGSDIADASPDDEQASSAETNTPSKRRPLRPSRGTEHTKTAAPASSGDDDAQQEAAQPAEPATEPATPEPAEPDEPSSPLKRVTF